jgi:dipeptidyl aminopeptidase/acylaminoacyl peptidase
MEVPLIPRKVLFGNPDKIQPSLSPDGVHLAFLAPVDGVLNIWVGPADDPDAAWPVTYDRGRGIQEYFWAYTNKHILYIQDRDGDENWRIYSVDISNGHLQELTPLTGVQARIYNISHKFPSEILIGLNNRDARLHDVYRLNIETGELTLIVENTENFFDFLSDDMYNVRFAIRSTADGGMEMLQAVNGR